MFAIGIRYLRGVAVASDPGDYDSAEWPPHPARVFMALAAAHFETGGDAKERAALEWLEGTSQPPSLSAPDAYHRTVVTRYVPVNDRAGPSKAILQSAPALTRDRAGRTFPTATLADELVYLTWPDECPEEHRAALQRLCEKATRVGHSSSLVQMWVEPEPPEPNWVPNADAPRLRLRALSTGLVEQLQQSYELQMRPRISIWAGYRAAGQTEKLVLGTVWRPEFLVLSLEPMESTVRHLDLVSTLQLMERLHKAVLSRCPEPVPEVVSGHSGDGRPTEKPHLAYIPLPFVGHRHADGLIRGIGVLLPNTMSAEDRRTALRAVVGVKELRIGRLGRWRLQPVAAEPALKTLEERLWVGGTLGAQQWGTVTPIAFDRHPKAKDDGVREAERIEMIAAACRRIGLPEPVAVITTPVSAHLGAPVAHEYPRMPRKDGSQRRHAHAILTFAEPVHGPIVLGAGRYRGYGLCLPLGQGSR